VQLLSDWWVELRRVLCIVILLRLAPLVLVRLLGPGTYVGSSLACVVWLCRARSLTLWTAVVSCLAQGTLPIYLTASLYRRIVAS
jgi:hypothetical protein